MARIQQLFLDRCAVRCREACKTMQLRLRAWPAPWANAQPPTALPVIQLCLQASQHA